MGAGPLHVVATAGHVDHGKSSLILRLTGMDPDRWDEEKRRGLTIDLGFAWTTLPSGREIGFVDVPGHERFVRNMLAGAGPVRLVLFVVAADEGWRPQSEEHLAIVDVLGASGGVVALTKADLVEEATLGERVDGCRARLAGTAMERAAIVPCSSTTGSGIDQLIDALDAVVARAPAPAPQARARMHVDRSFSIRGAGTVVTGTLVAGSLRPGAEIVLHPEGATARIRSLQTHRRTVELAQPVSRVAANLSGIARSAVERGDVLALPGEWRPTMRFDAWLAPVRGLTHPLTARGAYKLYAGSAERDARIRLYETDAVRSGERAYVHVRLGRPLVLAAGDRFVLRDSGRRTTVAGGGVLDPHPPGGGDAVERLRRRDAAADEDLPQLAVAERGAVRAADLAVMTGVRAGPVQGTVRIGEWLVAADDHRSAVAHLLDAIAEHHREHPLRPGIAAEDARRILQEAPGRLADPLASGLAQGLLSHLEEEGRIARDGPTVRLAGHAISLGGREPHAARLVEAVRGAEPTPPSVRELVEAGHDPELIRAACDTGRLVRVADDVVVTPELAARAEDLARREAAAPEGLTVARFRELLGATRRTALPLLEWLDARGVTRRDGDVRRLRPAP